MIEILDILPLPLLTTATIAVMTDLPPLPTILMTADTGINNSWARLLVWYGLIAC